MSHDPERVKAMQLATEIFSSAFYGEEEHAQELIAHLVVHETSKMVAGVVAAVVLLGTFVAGAGPETPAQRLAAFGQEVGRAT